jgi:hypothetical protein
MEEPRGEDCGLLDSGGMQRGREMNRGMMAGVRYVVMPRQFVWGDRARELCSKFFHVILLTATIFEFATC